MKFVPADLNRMQQKNARPVSEVQRYYEQNIGSYDRVRFGSTGGNMFIGRNKS